MAKRRPLGPKTLVLSEEANKQYDVAIEATAKLADLSKREWYIMTGTLLNEYKFISGCIGAAVTGTAIGLAILGKKIYNDRKKNKTRTIR